MFRWNSNSGTRYYCIGNTRRTISYWYNISAHRGGGIITGISIAAKHIKPDIKIIGVQTAACPAMVASLKENKFYEMYPTEESICDALVGGSRIYSL